MKKIMIIAPGIIANKSVASVRMTSLLRYLDALGYSVCVITNEGRDIGLYKSERISYCFVSGILETAGIKPFSYNRDLYIESVNKTITAYKPQVAIVSMGPFYVYKLSSLFHKHGIKVIVDFRDPWTFDIRERKEFFKIKNLISLGMKIPMERSCVHHADNVVTVSEGWYSTFRKLYFFQKNKFQLIKNGYDDDIISKLEFSDYQEKNGGILKIGVFGKLFYYTREYSEIFLDGVTGLSDDCHIVQIGEREDSADELLKEKRIPQNYIESTGFLSYGEGMKKLNTLDAYLIIDCRKDAIGTKIYDYIYFGKPIVYVGPSDSCISEMVRKLGNGYVCSTSSEVHAALINLINNPISLNSSSEMYSRSEQNKKWVKLIENE